MTDNALATVLSRAESERDQILAALRRAEEHARRAQAQAAQLLTYRAEYEQRWQGQFARGGNAEIVQCYRSFMVRLDEALAQQRAQADAAAANDRRLRDRFIEAERRVASVRKLIERRLAEQQRAHAVREQRQSDEHAMQLRQRLRDEPIHH
jgi:flagellar FliJ protein